MRPILWACVLLVACIVLGLLLSQAPLPMRARPLDAVHPSVSGMPPPPEHREGRP